MEFKAVIFDVDGTLIDSRQHHLESTLTVAKQMGLSVPSAEEILETFGMPAKGYVGKFWPEIDLKDFDTAYEACGFRTRKILPIPGAKEAIEIIRRNHFIGIITNRRSFSLKRRFMDIGLQLDIFDFVQTADYALAAKPDPRVFDTVLSLLKRKYGISKQHALYAGDTPIDFFAAKGAGLSFVGILDGGASRKTFLKNGLKKEYIISIKDLPFFMEGFKVRSSV